MASPDPIKTTALRLRNAAPDAWEAFLHALDADAYHYMCGLVTAQSTEILMKQGQVQGVNRWLQKFKECDLEKPQPRPLPA